MLSSTSSLLLMGLSVAPSAMAFPRTNAARAGVQAQNWPGWSGVKHLFTFGNSYTQTGFDVKGTQPNDENPMGNPAYPGYTSSNGPNWVGFLTTTHNESVVYTYNMAYGGATVDSDLVPPYEPTVVSLKEQVLDQWASTYGSGSAAPWKSDDSLFAFFIGINDVGNTYWDQNATLHDSIFEVYSGLVDTLYRGGARNFLFLNVPPIERAPLTVEQGPDSVALEKAAVEDWNEHVVTMATNLRTKYNGTFVAEFDYHGLFGDVMDDPTLYPETAGLKNTTEYCAAYEDGTGDDWYFLDPSCGIPVNEYLWLNNLHPTFAVNNATSRAIVDQLNASP